MRGCVFGAFAQVMVAAGNFSAGRRYLPGSGLHLCYQAAQRGLHVCHGLHELAHFVAVVRHDVLRQIPGGYPLGHHAGHVQRTHDGARAPKGDGQHHQHGCQRHGGDEHFHVQGLRCDLAARGIQLGLGLHDGSAEQGVGIVDGRAHKLRLLRPFGGADQPLLDLLQDRQQILSIALQ